MTGTIKSMSEQWEDATNLTGVTTASLLVVLLVSTAVGALIGLALGGRIEPGLIAMIAGLLGTITGSIVRNTLLIKAWGAIGVEDTGTPVAVIVNAALASFTGSLAADRIAIAVGTMPSVVHGAFAGLLSSILLAFLMVVYRMNPDFPEKPW